MATKVSIRIAEMLPPEGYKACHFCKKFFEVVNKAKHPCFMSEQDQQKRALRLAKEAARIRDNRISNDYWTSANEEEYQRKITRRKRDEASEEKLLLDQKTEDSVREIRSEKKRLEKERALELARRKQFNV